MAITVLIFALASLAIVAVDATSVHDRAAAAAMPLGPASGWSSGDFDQSRSRWSTMIGPQAAPSKWKFTACNYNISTKVKLPQSQLTDLIWNDQIILVANNYAVWQRDGACLASELLWSFSEYEKLCDSSLFKAMFGNRGYYLYNRCVNYITDEQTLQVRTLPASTGGFPGPVMGTYTNMSTRADGIFDFHVRTDGTVFVAVSLRSGQPFVAVLTPLLDRVIWDMQIAAPNEYIDAIGVPPLNPMRSSPLLLLATASKFRPSSAILQLIEVATTRSEYTTSGTSDTGVGADTTGAGTVLWTTTVQGSSFRLSATAGVIFVNRSPQNDVVAINTTSGAVLWSDPINSTPIESRLSATPDSALYVAHDSDRSSMHVLTSAIPGSGDASGHPTHISDIRISTENWARSLTIRDAHQTSYVAYTRDGAVEGAVHICRLHGPSGAVIECNTACSREATLLAAVIGPNASLCVLCKPANNQTMIELQCAHD